MEELVFAIPTDKLWKLIPYKEKGLIKGNIEVLKTIVQEGLFRKRSELEEDPSFKQIIPYAIISNRDSFFLFKRKSGQREKRLHNKFTLGAGGHMNPNSTAEPDVIQKSDVKSAYRNCIVIYKADKFNTINHTSI